MNTYPINDQSPELLGIHSTNFAMDANSSPRSVMYASHLSQALVVLGATEKRFQTGVESVLGEFTFSVKMPEDGIIVRVVDRYPSRIDQDAIQMSPESLVIYIDDKTKELGCFSIPYYKALHRSFGFKYVMNQANIARLVPGAAITKGTVFADSPNIKENGGYAYGIELNFAPMTLPGGSEDGVVISESACNKLKIKVFENRVIECGNNAWPLNLYGTKDRYQPFPEIGELIREDGILMALRPYDAELAPVEMSVYDAMEPIFGFDFPTYVRGPGGRVIDVKVYHNENETSPMPSGVMDNVDKYHRALQRFYTELINVETQVRAERKRKYGESTLAIKPELDRLLVEGRAVLAEKTNKSNQKLHMHYRRTPIDVYRIDITLEYELTPTIGFKLTDENGG